jgi:hypothetical protein
MGALVHRLEGRITATEQESDCPAFIVSSHERPPALADPLRTNNAGLVCVETSTCLTLPSPVLI